MDVLVSTQAAGVFEGLGTRVAGVRTLTGVLPQVILEVRTPFEGQGAIGADEGAYPSVDALMDLQKQTQM